MEKIKILEFFYLINSNLLINQYNYIEPIIKYIEHIDNKFILIMFVDINKLLLI